MPAPTILRVAARALAGSITLVLLWTSVAFGVTVPSAPKALGPAVGFGAKATGGAGGAVYHVTSAADTLVPGTLRWGLAQPQPLWIVFDGDVTINLTAGMPVASNKTIDGRGRHVTLTGHGQQGLLIQGVRNVIVESLTFRDFGDTLLTAQNDPDDAIAVMQSTDVWIDHNDLSMAGDKLIAVGLGSSGVTISWNHFHNQQQTVQIGAQANAAVDVNITVTIHHNFFDRSGYRNPVASYGRVHVYDNYLLGWTNYGVRSERGAQVYVENNVFQPETSLYGTRITPSGDGCNDAKTRCDDRPGYLLAVGNYEVSRTKLLTNSPELVFQPAVAYKYQADVAGETLRKAVMTGAGPA